MADDPTRGIYGKYHVKRTDGKPVSRCIVLELKDPLARVGILAWADAVEAAGYEALASDARAWVAEAEQSDDPKGGA